MRFKTERFIKSIGFGIFYTLIIIVIGKILKLENKAIGLTLISTGIFDIFNNYLKKKNYFAKNTKGEGK